MTDSTSTVIQAITLERLVEILASHADPGPDEICGPYEITRSVIEDLLYLGFIDRSKVTMPKAAK